MSKKGRQGTKDLVSGFFFSALGLSLSILSVTQFSVWEKGEPQEGFFPFLTGLLMMTLGMTVAFRSYMKQIHGKEKTLSERRKEFEEGNSAAIRMIGYLILMGVYVSLFEKLGFVISSTIFLGSVLKMLERKGWRITLLVTFGAVLTSYFLFRFFLDVPLPPGPI
jgi:NADH:ubiquinone oxidoreductase subunit 5 (subunit L)/multisubunit Na+/H+ antiporter MnhA subunit